jgi:hypothetical protein
MNANLETKLAAAGWKTGDATDFFGLSDDQRQLLDVRVAMAKAIRRQRLAQNVTQKNLAIKLHSTQPRVAKIEAAAADVSFDQMLRALVVLGGGITIHGPRALRQKTKAAKRRSLK